MFIEDISRIKELSQNYNLDLVYIGWEVKRDESPYLKTLYFIDDEGVLQRYRVSPSMRYTGREKGDNLGNMIRSDSDGNVDQYMISNERYNDDQQYNDKGWTVKWSRLSEDGTNKGETYSINSNVDRSIFINNMREIHIPEYIINILSGFLKEFIDLNTQLLFAWKDEEKYGFYLGVDSSNRYLFQR